MSQNPLISIRNLRKTFPMKGGNLTALEDIDLFIQKGEVLGLVGESGCGKSTLGKILTRLESPTSGTLLYDNQPLFNQGLYKQIQAVFQDPYASLNPRMTVGEILKEPFKIHKEPCPTSVLEKLLGLVNLSLSFLDRFPHELSGGQRQRICIARALALNPAFLVCDEAISALDVSVSAQILNLLKHLQKTLDLTLLFISHDLRAIHYLASRTCVMYLGQLMELAPTSELYKNPLHPYTQALVSAIPVPDPKIERARPRLLLQGEVPSPLSPPKGCAFASRCPKATALCHQERPLWKEVSPGRFTRCHYTSTACVSTVICSDT